jgi:hypothetical protein
VGVKSPQGPPPQRQAGVRDDVELGHPEHFRQQRRVDQQGAEDEERGPEHDLGPDADLLRGDLAGVDLLLLLFERGGCWWWWWWEKEEEKKVVFLFFFPLSLKKKLLLTASESPAVITACARISATEPLSPATVANSASLTGRSDPSNRNSGLKAVSSAKRRPKTIK